MPWQHPPGARPDVRVRSATIKATAPLMVEVRAVKGAVVYADDMEIPGDQFVHVERSPHIMRAIRAGDLEQRPRSPEQPTAAALSKASNSATPAQKPAKQAAKVPESARRTPKRAVAPKQKSAKRQAKLTQQTASQRSMTLASEVALSIINKKNPEGYGNRSIARLVGQVRNKKTWEEECKAMDLDPESLEPPSRDTIARIIGRRRD